MDLETMNGFLTWMLSGAFVYALAFWRGFITGRSNCERKHND